MVFAFRESRTDLNRVTAEIEVEMKGADMKFVVNRVREEDMLLTEGKVDLLGCSLWLVVGVLLLNDVPIPLTAAGQILDIANETFFHKEKRLILRRTGLFGVDYHIGILAGDGSVGYLLRGSLFGLPPEHSLEDILKVMKSNCKPGELHLTRF